MVSISPKLERPVWLRAPAPAGENYRELKRLVGELKLHTVCESAACPNVGECWNQRAATFMRPGAGDRGNLARGLRDRLRRDEGPAEEPPLAGTLRGEG